MHSMEASHCPLTQVPYKFSAFDGFGKERARAGDAVPVDYSKFVATVKKGVEGVIFESGGSTAIALTGEGNTMLRAEVKARAARWSHGATTFTVACWSPERPSLRRPAGRRSS